MRPVTWTGLLRRGYIHRSLVMALFEGLDYTFESGPNTKHPSNMSYGRDYRDAPQIGMHSARTDFRIDN